MARQLCTTETFASMTHSLLNFALNLLQLDILLQRQPSYGLALLSELGSEILAASQVSHRVRVQDVYEWTHF